MSLGVGTRSPAPQSRPVLGRPHLSHPSHNLSRSRALAPHPHCRPQGALLSAMLQRPGLCVFAARSAMSPGQLH
eukprot:3939551-Rhodomonas_salina.1